MSGAGHASEAIFSRLYLAYKTTYSRALCNLQYLSIVAAKLARITGVRSLVSEWQGRELVKSAAYPQLSENDCPTGEQKSRYNSLILADRR